MIKKEETSPIRRRTMGIINYLVLFGGFALSLFIRITLDNVSYYLIGIAISVALGAIILIISIFYLDKKYDDY